MKDKIRKRDNLFFLFILGSILIFSGLFIHMFFDKILFPLVIIFVSGGLLILWIIFVRLKSLYTISNGLLMTKYLYKNKKKKK